MRALLCLLLMGVLAAQNSQIGESRQPEIKTPFAIDYLDLPYPDTSTYKGQVLVRFIVDERGKVVCLEVSHRVGEAILLFELGEEIVRYPVFGSADELKNVPLIRL